MINLNKEALRAYENAERRGLPLDNRSIDKHLQEEVNELMDSGNIRNPMSLKGIINSREDMDFLFNYSSQMKDSMTDELADTIIICLTKAKANGIDIESAVMIKQRVNSIRVD